MLKALSEIINDGTKNLMNVLFTYPQQLHGKEQSLALQPELDDTQ